MATHPIPEWKATVKKDGSLVVPDRLLVERDGKRMTAEQRRAKQAKQEQLYAVAKKLGAKGAAAKKLYAAGAKTLGGEEDVDSAEEGVNKKPRNIFDVPAKVYANETGIGGKLQKDQAGAGKGAPARRFNSDGVYKEMINVGGIFSKQSKQCDHLL